MLVRKQVDFAHVLLVSIACSLLAVTSATLSPGDAGERKLQPVSLNVRNKSRLVTAKSE